MAPPGLSMTRGSAPLEEAAPRSWPRVLLLTSTFPRHPGDAVGDFLARYARALELSCRVVTPAARGLADAEESGDVRVERFRYWLPAWAQGLAHGAGMPDNLRRRPWLLAQAPTLLGAWTLAAAEAAHEADVIDAHWCVPAGLVGAAVSRVTGIPLRAVLHSGDVHVLCRWPGGALLAQAIARQASVITATSRHVAERFVGLLPEREREGVRARLDVTAMGVDVPEACGPPAARPPARVACVARLVPVKGVADLVEAMGGLQGVALDVAGDGPLGARLAARARSLGVRATFHGWLGAAAKGALLEAAHVAVVPSLVLPGGRTESIPVALLEAMAAGRPVVATRVGGIGEVVTQGVDGMLVPPGDVLALRRAIGALLADDALAARVGRAARERARAVAWDALGPAHRAALERAAGDTPPSSHHQ